MKKAMGFIKSNDWPPFAINIGLILNDDNRFNLPVCRPEMNAQTVESRLKILYPEFSVIVYR